MILEGCTLIPTHVSNAIHSKKNFFFYFNRLKRLDPSPVDVWENFANHVTRTD